MSKFTTFQGEELHQSRTKIRRYRLLRIRPPGGRVQQRRALPRRRRVVRVEPQQPLQCHLRRGRQGRVEKRNSFRKFKGISNRFLEFFLSQFRARACNSPVPKYGGEDCVGESRQTEACQTVDCHGGGSWSGWAPFGNCSTGCGCGIKTRYTSTM